ncbi:MAG: endonuclease/exonuclease/phosphatase family protein [Myxococcaceae bacterium]|nr:endonuclease/exonuclease/phosphatase family protein [Myxococcaceae bacterium]
MGFSVLSWNVEHFGNKKTSAERQKRVVKHIKDQDPDIFGILEVEHANIRALMEKSFDDYDFFLTDGPQLQEILVGCRRGLFDQKLFVQKREYQEGNDKLRPGALLSVRQGTVWTNLLFLHTDSGDDAGAFGNRFDSFRKVWNLTKALARKAPNGDPRLLVLGDFNTMGLSYPRSLKAHERVKEAEEIAGLAELARKEGLVLLPKSHPATYWSATYGESDLDHVLATEDLAKTISGKVQVRGWVQETTTAARRLWTGDVSDHSSVCVEGA